ncbi:MAG TPA: hypothetical protein VM778_07695 [Gemmatimonadota bacterium]|nr:hypothetical protein [Gemmatimonadota bacterium]
MRDGNHLERLLALQEIDVMIVGLEERRDAVPRRRAEAIGEITALEAEEAEHEESLERVRLDRRHGESELETRQEKLARYDRQLNEVKTNVAYSALLGEIQSTKREISDLEDQVLDLMARHEEHQGRLEEIRAQLGEMREAAHETLEALAGEEREIGRGLDAAHARRAGAAAEIEDRHLRAYDRLRRGRRFPALVPLKGRACGACFGSMPPQVVQEITHDATLHPCEACGALVYAESAVAGSSAGNASGRGPV